ncbi:MAG: pyridoxal phosphate-dependent decarboxylase family protein [Flammeovirgaceae bacterium]
MKTWIRRSPEEIRQTIFDALKANVNYYKTNVLGIPASHLDNRVFYQEAPFLKDAPFLSTLIHNPNHIGCHTLGDSESFFEGTQHIERELIAICAEDILQGEVGQQDGYVASGGTEANMQAIWIYRNYFVQEFQAQLDEIAILCSSDAHYSMVKSANVLNLSLLSVPVEEDSRQIDERELDQRLAEATKNGKKYFIVIANMMTTMFGSVDAVSAYANALDKHNCEYKIHVDGAYGGFFYPFSAPDNELSFKNPKINSVTLDAHKMVQAPYGTGIFLIRKGYMQYAITKEASYVKGEDYTIIGSRSGANAVAVWMILSTYGPFGWKEKILILLNRTNWTCKMLADKGIGYYRHPHSNIITIKSKHLTPELAERFGLVPDVHDNPKWYKIVIMEHVTMENLIPLVEAIEGLAVNA